MSHRDAVRAYLACLEGQGVELRIAAPPEFRALWALGLRVPPPFYLSPFGVGVLQGVPRGVLAAAIGGMLLILVHGGFHGMSPMAGALGGGLACAWMVGRRAATCYADRLRGLRLPPWEAFLAGART